MMHFWLLGIALVLAALASLYFSTVTYSLRDFSRTKLEAELERRKRDHWLEPDRRATRTIWWSYTAVFRLIANTLILILVLRLFYDTGWSLKVQYLCAMLVAGVISLFCSVAIPHALAEARAGKHCRFVSAPDSLAAGGAASDHIHDERD
jgi:Mg2+/Co2+ transporter CorB